MNQLKDVHQEENDFISPDSLEWRANRIAQELYVENSDQTFSLITSGSTELQQNFREKFPLDHGEINIVLQYIIYKISEDLFSRNINTPFVCLCYIARCIIFLIEIYKDTNSDIFIDKFSGIFASDTESNKVVLASLTCFIRFQYNLKKDQLEKILRDFGLQDFDRNLFGQLFGYIISTYCSYGPDYWVKKLTELEGGYEKDILLSTPFLWTEEEFAKSAKPTQLKNHVRINGVQYKLDVKARKTFERLHSPVRHWFVRLCKNSYGKIEFDMIPDLMSKGVLGAFHINKSLLGSSSNMDNLDETMPLVFEDIIALPHPKFDEDKVAKILEDIRSFDAQKSLSEKAQPIVENVSQDVTTLTRHAFTNPKQHHTDIAQSLGLDILDHTDDIGPAEGVIIPHLRYKNSHGTSSLHYLPKIAWLIDLLEDIIPRNEHGKITAYTLPSSPYVFIYTNTGTIFISDVDNIATQVFAQKVDPSFINTDFSFSALGGLFGPLTSIKNNFEEVISDEKAESWAKNIVDALAKKDGYFPDLMSDGQPRWGINLRALYHSGEMTKKNFATPIALKQFLENYNRIILLRSDITIKQKQDLSVVNSRGGVPNTQSLINALGGHSFFTSYHGHAPFFSEYFDTLLSNNVEYKDALYERLRSKNKVKSLVENWISELKNGVRTISENQLHQLFSTDTHVKKSMRKELDVPFGLLTSTSWIIALGYDPEQCIQGETPEVCLRRILIQENIIPGPKGL